MSSRIIRRRILGARLWRARLKAGLSQQDVAAALDRGQSAVSRIEQGDREVRASEVTVLAQLYNTTVESLIGPFSPEEAHLEEELRKNVKFDHPLLPRRQPWRRSQ